jgi:hypothetical protein
MQGSSAIRRVLVTALLVAVTAVIAGGVSLARAGGTGSGDADVLVLKEKQTKSVFVNVNPNGPAGNEFVFHSTLSNASGQVGTVDGLCVFVLARTAQCHVTATLPGGTLTVSALLPASNRPVTTHGSIDGGTGRYDEARGQVTIVPQTNTLSTDTFDID